MNTYMSYPSAINERRRRIVCAPAKPRPHNVPDEVYRDLAEQIRTECEYSGKESVKIKVECERDGFLYTVEASMYCYFGRSRELWGVEYSLKGLAPCWVEFHAYNDDGDEILNDFDLSKFNKLITF